MNFEHLQRSKREFDLMANEQERKGIEKYGKPLEPMNNYDWLKMCVQEQVDGFKYLVAEQEKRRFVADKIQAIVNDRCDEEVALEVNHWLDVLEGRL